MEGKGETNLISAYWLSAYGNVFQRIEESARDCEPVSKYDSFSFCLRLPKAHRAAIPYLNTGFSGPVSVYTLKETFSKVVFQDAVSVYALTETSPKIV